jgi:hypothetical protein
LLISAAAFVPTAGGNPRFHRTSLVKWGEAMTIGLSELSRIMDTAARITPNLHLFRRRCFIGAAALLLSVSASISQTLSPSGVTRQMSADWSGFILTPQCGTCSLPFVGGGWTVPEVKYDRYPQIAPQVEIMSTWIGIGGWNGDYSLIQIGIQEQAAPPGVGIICQGAAAATATCYTPFWETITALGVDSGPQWITSGCHQLSPPTGASVPCILNPGDKMYADIQLDTINNNKTAMFFLVIEDETHNWVWAPPNMGEIAFTSSLATVEWIVEAPTNTVTSLKALPAFGSVEFRNANIFGETMPISVNGNGIWLRIGNPKRPAFGGESFPCSVSNPEGNSATLVVGDCFLGNAGTVDNSNLGAARASANSGAPIVTSAPSAADQFYMAPAIPCDVVHQWRDGHEVYSCQQRAH